MINHPTQLIMLIGDLWGRKPQLRTTEKNKLDFGQVKGVSVYGSHSNWGMGVLLIKA